MQRVLERALETGKMGKNFPEIDAALTRGADAALGALCDQRRQAGDYAYQRAISHSETALQAIDSPAIADPRTRALAPDLSLSPLLQP